MSDSHFGVKDKNKKGKSKRKRKKISNKKNSCSSQHFKTIVTIKTRRLPDKTNLVDKNTKRGILKKII